MMFRKFALAVAFVLASTPAWADCANPTGTEGQIIYNADHKIPQYCNGTDWIAWGSGYVAGGSSSSIPTGFVGAFDLAACPDGWSEYTSARGRFLRGIDSTGTVDPDGVRIAGSTQEDAFQDHKHVTSGASAQSTASDFNSIFGGSTSTLTSIGAYAAIVTDHAIHTSLVNNVGNINYRTSTETRPTNVAVLYCRKD